MYGNSAQFVVTILLLFLTVSLQVLSSVLRALSIFNAFCDPPLLRWLQ